MKPDRWLEINLLGLVILGGLVFVATRLIDQGGAIALLQDRVHAISDQIGQVARDASEAAFRAQDTTVHLEVIPIPSLTLSDEQFLLGDDQGKAVTIAGTLRVASGNGRRPLVILVEGSGGFSENATLWERQLLRLGVSTFAMDSLSGRGIRSTVYDQSQLGQLNMILDLYRSLAVLAAHPLVDPSRIAVMGFSRGGLAVLYSSLKRFQKQWNRSGIDPLAYIALYPSCVTQYLGDTELSDHAIRIFHGVADDYVEIAPCRRYLGRLRGHAGNVALIEFPDTWHSYDNPAHPPTPVVITNAQTVHCALIERPRGTIVNAATGRPFTYADACVGRNPHEAYSAAATEATEGAVRNLLRTTFHLD